MPSSPLTTTSAASASASSCVTRRAIRSVSASSGRCTPGRSTSTSCQSGPVATPRIARLVVCGRLEVIATFVPTIAFVSVDLPTFGRPATATKPARVISPAEQLTLERKHLAVVELVVHADQVQRPVDDRLAQVGRVLRADHDVAELARPHRRRVVAINREREDVGGLVDRAVAPVELPDPRLADELDRDMAVEHARAGEGERGELLDLERRERDRA